MAVSPLSVQCMICFEDFSRKDMRSAACKHGFCVDCWSGYITNAIGNGPAVLDLRCPLPKCNAEVRDGDGAGGGGDGVCSAKPGMDRTRPGPSSSTACCACSYC